MKNMRQVVIDMDGTFVDLYGVENWEEQLHNSDVTPYEVAEPLVDMEEMRELLERIRLLGGVVTIVSWSAMGGSKEYNKEVKKAKMEWCKKYNLPFDNFHVVKYGTKKWYPLKDRECCVLLDDNAEVRAAFEDNECNRFAIDATELIETLEEIVRDLRVVFNPNKPNWQRSFKSECEHTMSPMFRKKVSNQTIEEGLYLLASTTFNPHTKEKFYWVKVGMTTNAKGRFNAYRTSSPSIYYVDWHNGDTHLEVWYQNILQQLMIGRHRSEWFRVNEDDYLSICEHGFNFFD